MHKKILNIECNLSVWEPNVTLSIPKYKHNISIYDANDLITLANDLLDAAKKLETEIHTKKKMIQEIKFNKEKKI